MREKLKKQLKAFAFNLLIVISGYALLWSISWKAAAGVFLAIWGNNMAQRKI